MTSDKDEREKLERMTRETMDRGGKLGCYGHERDIRSETKIVDVCIFEFR